MGDVAAGICSVAENSSANVRDDVHVGSTASVVTGEDCGELGDTVRVRGLEAT